MSTESLIKELEAYALEHYEQGSHWVYETFSKVDYEKVLYECKGDLEEAKKDLKETWELLCEQERNCAWGD